MNTYNIQPNFQVAYVDTNLFAQEGFTSGLLIEVKQILILCNNHSFDAGIISFSSRNTYSKKNSILTSTFSLKKESGIPIIEFSISKEQMSASSVQYDSFLKRSFGGLEPKIIFLTSPALCINDLQLSVLKYITDNLKSTVVHIVADDLFPGMNEKNAKKYYELMKKGHVLSISNQIKKQLMVKVGVDSERFMNLFDMSDIITAPENKNPEFITLVNHHPLKGREIFDGIAEKKENYKFKVIESWPDVPPYKNKNVSFSKFFKSPSKLYAQVKCLLIPSLCQEGAARVGMEAMMNGIPVIAHNIGSLSEIYGNHAFYVQPPEPIDYELQGTILTPIIHPEEKERVVNDFCVLLDDIYNNENHLKQHLIKAKSWAISYAKKGEERFVELIKEWL